MQRLHCTVILLIKCGNITNGLASSKDPFRRLPFVLSLFVSSTVEHVSCVKRFEVAWGLAILAVSATAQVLVATRSREHFPCHMETECIYGVSKGEYTEGMKPALLFSIFFFFFFLCRLCDLASHEWGNATRGAR